jgi:segregation and condensation protein B
MKDSKKKDILSGAAGMAAGAAGTIGAHELRDYMNEQEETPIEEIDDTAQVTHHQVAENQQESHAQQQQTPISHQDFDEIQPVASVTETIEIDASEEIQELMDVDPNEIAEAIIEEAEDPEEVLLAMNDDKDDVEGDDEDDDDDAEDEDGEIEDDIDDDLPDIEESIA